MMRIPSVIGIFLVCTTGCGGPNEGLTTTDPTSSALAFTTTSSIAIGTDFRCGLIDEFGVDGTVPWRFSYYVSQRHSFAGSNIYADLISPDYDTGFGQLFNENAATLDCTNGGVGLLEIAQTDAGSILYNPNPMSCHLSIHDAGHDGGNKPGIPATVVITDVLAATIPVAGYQMLSSTDPAVPPRWMIDLHSTGQHGFSGCLGGRMIFDDLAPL